MCGIVGLISKSPIADIPLSSLNAMRHRGPDDSGSEQMCAGPAYAWLGHTRLAILDLSSAGHQPMRSRDGRWWVTFNGEIYNHLDIRCDLNVEWRGHSDTETLVEAISAWGVDRAVLRLNGIFAFGAVDTLYGRVFLVRDPHGIKPLYYQLQTSTLAFASEIKAIRAVSGGEIRIDRNELQTFLALRYVPGPQTLFEGIQRLQPGHILEFDPLTFATSSRSFISVPRDRFRGSLNDAVEEYRRRLCTAVRQQLLSDVPVGVLLSGGIDSALVAASALESGQVLPGFTVGFGNEYSDSEISDAAETARTLGIPHHSITVTHEQLWGVLEDCVRHVEEPLGTTSILPMWYLVERARRDVTVVLTGQGSDETWGGYRRYQGELIRQLIPIPGLWCSVKMASHFFGRMPDAVERALASFPVRDVAERFRIAYALFNDHEREELTGRADNGSATTAIRYWINQANMPGTDDSAELMMRIDARMNLADDLLLYNDKISMAHSLEARVPMLDLNLVRFIESLPRRYRVTLGKTKLVHKLAAQRYLPSAIVSRPKRAFQVPFAAWARSSWKDRISDILLSQDAFNSALNREVISRMLADHIRGKRDFGRQIFALLTLAMLLSTLS